MSCNAIANVTSDVVANLESAHRAHIQVWGWHLTPEASAHPGSTGFGWFFRYLTFYSFSLQFGTLGLSCLSDITREVRRPFSLQVFALSRSPPASSLPAGRLSSRLASPVAYSVQRWRFVRMSARAVLLLLLLHCCHSAAAQNPLTDARHLVTLQDNKS